jgi:hypothetical protein
LKKYELKINAVDFFDIRFLPLFWEITLLFNSEIDIGANGDMRSIRPVLWKVVHRIHTQTDENSNVKSVRKDSTLSKRVPQMLIFNYGKHKRKYRNVPQLHSHLWPQFNWRELYKNINWSITWRPNSQKCDHYFLLYFDSCCIALWKFVSLQNIFW